jgi:hypothetical protein
VWEPQLGGIELNDKPVVVTWRFPKKFDRHKTRGWFPIDVCCSRETG